MYFCPYVAKQLTPNAFPYASCRAASNGLATTSVASGGTGDASARFAERDSAPRKYCGSSTRARSIGCPTSSQSAVRFRNWSASDFIAPRPTSYGAEGNAQALPSGIDPKPQASRPAPVRTRHCTLSSVTSSTVRPPNWYGARYLKSSNACVTSRMRISVGLDLCTPGACLPHAGLEANTGNTAVNSSARRDNRGEISEAVTVIES